MGSIAPLGGRTPGHRCWQQETFRSPGRDPAAWQACPRVPRERADQAWVF